MHVTQLLALLARAPHVEIVEPPLPEMIHHRAKQLPLSGRGSLSSQQPPRHALLQYLHYPGGIAPLRFADQQMDVFRHYHVPDHHEPVAAPDFLQNAQEHVASWPRCQQRSAAITASGDEVQMLAAVVAAQGLCHALKVYMQFLRLLLLSEAIGQALDFVLEPKEHGCRHSRFPPFENREGWGTQILLTAERVRHPPGRKRFVSL